MNKPKILFWDLETTDLKGDKGSLLSFHYGWAGSNKVSAIKVSDSPAWKRGDFSTDRWVAKEGQKILVQADGWVTHYGTYFDIPMMRTRLIKNNLPPIPQPQSQVKHFDTWWYCRKQFQWSSNRLDWVAKRLGVTHRKTEVDFDIWMKASRGHMPSLRYIYKHGNMDIVVLKEVYEKLIPYVASPQWINMCNYAQRPVCVNPSCGSSNVQYRGPLLVTTGEKHRYQCMECGKWASTAPIAAETKKRAKYVKFRP